MARRETKRTLDSVDVTELDERPNGFSFSHTTVRYRPDGTSKTSRRVSASFSTGGPRSAPPAPLSSLGSGLFSIFEQALRNEMGGLDSIFRDLSMGSRIEDTERSERPRPRRSESGRSERSTRTERTTRSERSERTARGDERSERSTRSDARSDRTARTERSERTAGTERSERTARSERSERTARTERPERPERRGSQGERKETERERAERLFAREQRAQQRMNERIRRANGDKDYAPPNPFSSSGSTRRTQRTGSVDSAAGSSTTGFEQRIPPRYSSSRSGPTSPTDPFDMFEETMRNFGFSSSGMPGGFPFRPFDFPFTSGAGAPPMAGRSDEEYLRSIRDEFDRARRTFEEGRRSQRTQPNPDFSGEHRAYEHRDEGRHSDPYWAPRDSAHSTRQPRSAGAEESFEAREARRAAEREAQAERVRRAKELEKERAAKRAEQRAAWSKRCGALFANGEIQSVHLTFQDIPWPIYAVRGEVEYIVTLDDLSATNVKEFLLDMARDNTTVEYEVARRKVLRDAIRLFHPDRWHRVLPRVKEAERDNVKTGVELCSRIINDMLST